MHSLGLFGVLPKKNLSIRRREGHIFPYLLSKFPPSAENTVWCTDATYVRTTHGYVYFVALIDVLSRKIVGYDISIMPDTFSAQRALNMALEGNYRWPSLINTDQGSQFTSKEWVSAVRSHGFSISMDGKGRWADNIWIERFCRSAKYEPSIYRKLTKPLMRLVKGLLPMLTGTTMRGYIRRLTIKHQSRCISTITIPKEATPLQ